MIAIPGLGILRGRPNNWSYWWGCYRQNIGGLIDLGIPEEKAKDTKPMFVKVRLYLQCKLMKKKVEDIRNILQSNGAERVNAH